MVGYVTYDVKGSDGGLILPILALESSSVLGSEQKAWI